MTDLPLLTSTLAQSPAAAGRVVFWCGVLLIAAAGLALAAWWLRRRLIADDDAEPLPMGFSLSDLRKMHERGELSDEEFEHAKRRMVAGTRARMEAENQGGTASEAKPGAQGPPKPSPEPDGGIVWDTPPDDQDA